MNEMPSDHPQTPESPSQVSYGTSEIHTKPSTSPPFANSLPTPAHSINGSMSSLGLDTVPDGNTYDEVSNKRKREAGDNGDRDLKKVHVEDSRLSIEDLHLDVGKKYLLCRTPHPGQTPLLSQDLFERYSLHGVAQTVARTKPDGTKNPLRKTYKKYIKTLGLSGSFDVGKKEIDAPDTLLAMMSQPEEEWSAQFVRGQEIEKGLSEDVTDSLGRAMSMARGTIPKNLWDGSVLGEIVAAGQLPHDSSKSTYPTVRAGTPQHASLARAGKGEIPRPKRNIKKRSYGDSSYEGYGDGFVDDETHETGYSTGDGDDRAGRKRPKKTGVSNSFQSQGPMRQNSYGPGMVGI